MLQNSAFPRPLAGEHDTALLLLLPLHASLLPLPALLLLLLQLLSLTILVLSLLMRVSSSLVLIASRLMGVRQLQQTCSVCEAQG